MTEHYFITGTSTGIGKALTEALLQRPKVRVTGFSRTCSIEHANYTHVVCDLSTEVGLASVNFQPAADATKVVLVNNAGTLGQVGPIGRIDDGAIAQTFFLNTIAPAILMNRFVAQLQQHQAQKLVLNVSSGAGKQPIDGWASYCGSKAALDLFTQTAQEEVTVGQTAGFHFLSVAPGIVDTPMQAHIRAGDPANFTGHQRFVEYHQEGELTSPEVVAAKYLMVLDEPDRFPDVLYSLRDI